MTAPYYQDDRVTLYHGDCLEVDVWLDADVLVTDPPYGMRYVSGMNKDRRRSVLRTHLNSQARDRPDHPTPKPLTLMERLIEKCPGGIIADPFAGSGSTLIATRNLGRKAIGVEIEERYCELIAKRLDQMCLDFEEPA